MRAVHERGVEAVLTEHRQRLQNVADSLSPLIETVDRYIVKGIPVKASRITQVTIVADGLQASIAFYRDAFDAAYNEDIGSCQLGTYPDDDFFLLTVANPARRPWPGGPAKFGLLVEDVDAADPGGNHVDLYQG
ncbi:VOC family protein [Actinomadura barringtoniae]|uniref:VOC family protein n=1 Tax=Actinomadura barringtoniae TaxID=1427535 RepID=A0A939PHX8_9ACTN|nr:VOC family protein [Actinomadura barringtoniae]MBO2452518.1 VOC family protein [Actinomadura barringtoniae]